MDEYFTKAALFAQTAAQLSRKVGEGLADKASQINLDGHEAKLYETSHTKLADISQLLDSASDKDKLTALKRLIAMISRGKDVGEYFASVVKNVASNNLEVRKLVYIYLLRYAENEPDLALLAINTFQKDLSDPNPNMRALALRLLSGLRVKMVSSIVLLAIRKAASDLSPFVRRSAAFALIKCYQLDPNTSQRDKLIDLLKVYLQDTNPLSLGSVLIAFNQICPDRYDLIHPHYRKVCRLFGELDEWSQIAALDLFLRYARLHFVNPNADLKKENKELRKDNQDSDDDFYKDSVATSGSNRTHQGSTKDNDLILLLQSVQPLLLSQNSGVVVATSSLIYHLTSENENVEIGRPLVRLLRSNPEIKNIVLNNIAVMAQARPKLFSPYLSHFFIMADDDQSTRELKLDIATNIVTSATLPSLLQELQTYAVLFSDDSDLVTLSIRALGRCAIRSPKLAAPLCLKSLIELVEGENPIMVGEAIAVIRQLLQDPVTTSEANIDPIPYLHHLIYILHNRQNIISSAKSSILWLVGQYADILPNYAPDVLRVATKSFRSEDEHVKRQTLTLAIKLVGLWPDTEILAKILAHLSQLARYDLSYDLRDRARLISEFYSLKEPSFTDSSDTSISLLGGSDKTLKVFKSHKPAPVYESVTKDRARFTIGSASLQTNHPVPGFNPLPSWTEVMPDIGQARNVKEEDTVDVPQNLSSANFGFASGQNFRPATQTTPTKNVPQDLDSFYDEVTSEEDLEEDDTSGVYEASSSEQEGDEDEEDSDEEEEESEDSEYESDEEEENETEQVESSAFLPNTDYAQHNNYQPL